MVTLHSDIKVSVGLSNGIIQRRKVSWTKQSRSGDLGPIVLNQTVNAGNITFLVLNVQEPVRVI